MVYDLMVRRLDRITGSSYQECIAIRAWSEFTSTKRIERAIERRKVRTLRGVCKVREVCEVHETILYVAGSQ